MTVAKIIIQGPSKSYKSTLASFIAQTLENDCINVEVIDKDDDKNHKRFLDKKLDKLSESREVVRIEVVTTNRGNEHGSS